MRRASIRAAGLAAVAAAVLVSGCGYSIRPPFDKSIRTVYVPVFKSFSFRRDVNLQLTELTIKEIERRTPYKVVYSAEGADTILSGEVNFADKNLMVENPYNLPRELSAYITATVNWEPNTPSEGPRVPKIPVIVQELVYFTPEIGETSETAFYRACERMAQQIVGMMEAQWGTP